jgi:hypothetical protein
MFMHICRPDQRPGGARASGPRSCARRWLATTDLHSIRCPPASPNSLAGIATYGDAQVAREWFDRVVNDYKVAAYPSGRGRAGRVPEGTRHAYLKDAQTTACGFGLVELRLFSALRFSYQPPAVRCRMCTRIVFAVDH